MMKQPFSIAPWSLILSLYFVPAQDSYAQESDEVEDGESDSTDSTGETESVGPADSENSDISKEKNLKRTKDSESSSLFCFRIISASRRFNNV